MLLSDLQSERDRKRVSLLSGAGSVAYLSWHFVYRYLVPGAQDDLIGRAGISLLCFIIWRYSKSQSCKTEVLSKSFLGVLILILGHFGFMLNENTWSPAYQLGYLAVAGAVMACSGSSLDFFILAILSLTVPGIFSLFREVAPLTVVTFILFNSVIVFFLGIMHRLNVQYRNEILSLTTANINSARLADLGMMVAGIGHEISSPLAILKGRIEVLSRKLMTEKELNPAWYHEELKKIEKSGDKISKIIKGLKALSRNSEADQTSKIELKSLINETLELCNDKLARNRVRLICDPIPNLVLMVREAQLMQVLLNLINNSIDAVEKHSDKTIQLSFEDKGHKIAILVFDSGPKISPEVATRLSEPFFTTKPVGVGTGLGLSISRAILESHKGSLDYVPGERTCFKVEIPKNQL